MATKFPLEEFIECIYTHEFSKDASKFRKSIQNFGKAKNFFEDLVFQGMPGIPKGLLVEVIGECSFNIKLPKYSTLIGVGGATFLLNDSDLARKFDNFFETERTFERMCSINRKLKIGYVSSIVAPLENSCLFCQVNECHRDKAPMRLSRFLSEKQSELAKKLLKLNFFAEVDYVEETEYPQKPFVITFKYTSTPLRLTSKRFNSVLALIKAISVHFMIKDLTWSSFINERQNYVFADPVKLVSFGDVTEHFTNDPEIQKRRQYDMLESIFDSMNKMFLSADDQNDLIKLKAYIESWYPDIFKSSAWKINTKKIS